MKVWDPTFKQNSLTPNMDVGSIPHRAILLRAGMFHVIDGDTIHAAAGNQGKAFSIRFRSVNAAELPKSNGRDRLLQECGIDTHPDSLALKAKEILKTYLDGRALLALSSGKSDKYGRLLCDVYVVPYTGAKPDLKRAISVERLMLEQKVTDPFPNEPLPRISPPDQNKCEF